MMIKYFALAMLLCFPPTSIASSDPDPSAVMRENFMATKMSAFNGSVSMALTTSQGKERVRKISMWSKLKGAGADSEVLIRFDEPGDIKGASFLQIENTTGDDDIWIYLPALGKIRRMVASNKRDSFFGTDFSYGDILLPAVDKYEHTFKRTEAIDGHKCHVIESRPITAKTRDDSGYSRKMIWVDAKNFVERKVEYYDLSGSLFKTQYAYDIQQVEPEPQRWAPMRREMVNHQTGHKTV